MSILDEIVVRSLKELPSLKEEMDALSERSWHPSMTYGSEEQRQEWNDIHSVFADYQFGIVQKGSLKLIASGNCVPLRWIDSPSELPAQGWDWAIATSLSQNSLSIEPNVLVALSICVEPEYRSKGISKIAIQQMKNIAAEKGFDRLFAPVRPMLKADFPQMNIAEYAQKVNELGQPYDPWIRAHCNSGAKISHVCNESMTIEAPLSLWTLWSGVNFLQSGSYIVPGLLSPLKANLDSGVGTYVEPNVWVHHLVSKDLQKTG